MPNIYQEVITAETPAEVPKGERPELYQKLKKTGIDKGLDGVKLDASEVFTRWK